MKRKVIAVVLILLAVFTAGAEKALVSGHYTIYYPDSFNRPEEVARVCNAIREHFNIVFRFNPDPNRTANTLRILESKAAYDAYLAGRIGESRDDYIFLRYSRPDLSELVLFVNAPFESSDMPFSGPSFIRQLFQQYLYSHVAEPPLWIRDGFQAWFETTRWDSASGTVVQSEGTAWLESAKRLNTDPGRTLGIRRILEARTGSFEPAQLYPQAWAFTAFLMQSEDPLWQRRLWEALALLETGAAWNRDSQETNTTRIAGRMLRQLDEAEAEAAFSRWLAEQQTFNELMQAGVAAYNAGNYPLARTTLMKASIRSARDPLLNYYLGLVAYSEKDYSTADVWYRQALQYGADPATVNWALALSAWADRRWSDARPLLETARSLNPARYAERADTLLKNIPE